MAFELLIIWSVAIAIHLPLSNEISILKGQRQQDNFIHDALIKLTSVLRSEPEHYVLWIESKNSIIKRSIDNNLLSLNGIRLRLYFSCPNQTDELSLETNFRFTQPFQIIFSSYHMEKPWFGVNTLRYAMKLTTVFIYVRYYNTSLIYEPFDIKDKSVFMQNLPALKLYLQFQHNITTFSIECNGYCIQERHASTFWNVQSIKKLLHSPLKSHRLLFRNGNQRRNLAALVTRIGDFFDVYDNDRYACSRLLLRHKDSFYCETPIMSVIYMAQIHNISFSLLSMGVERDWRQLAFDYYSQTVWVLHTHSDIDTLFSRTGHYHYSQEQDLQFYCDFAKGEKLISGLTLWISAFTLDSWVLILSSILTIPIILNILHRELSWSAFKARLLEIILIFIGQFPSIISKQKGLYMSVAALSLLLPNLYGNAITSSVSVRTPLPSYELISDLLADGYKIVLNEPFNRTSSAADVLMSALERKGIHKKKNDVFHFHYGSIDLSHNIHFLRNRMSLGVAKNFANLFTHLRKRYVNFKQTKKLECRFVKESIQEPVFAYWLMYTVNRYWLMETVERIYQSGLRDKLMEWADWSYNLHGRTLEEMEDSMSKPVIEADVIDSRKLIAPFVLLAILIAICTAVFANETNFHIVRTSISLLKDSFWRNTKVSVIEIATHAGKQKLFNRITIKP